MKIIFTNHARERMQERGILESEVIECIRSADKILKKDAMNISRFQKLFSCSTLEVVGKHKGAYLIVITVYPL